METAEADATPGSTPQPSGQKHIQVTFDLPSEHGPSIETVSSQEELARSESVLVYVHGFSVTKATACQQARSIADKTKHPVLLFRWPTAPVPTFSNISEKQQATRLTCQMGYVAGNYFLDSTNVEAQNWHELLQHEIQKLRQNNKIVHLLAHSHGCELATRALEGLPKGTRLGCLIFAAPDVHVGNMNERLTKISKLYEDPKEYDCTIYVAKYDLALLASHAACAQMERNKCGPDQAWKGIAAGFLAGFPNRAGESYQAVERLGFPAPAFRNHQLAKIVDCTEVAKIRQTMDGLRHSYFMSDEALGDIKLVLEKGNPEDFKATRAAWSWAFVGLSWSRLWQLKASKPKEA